MKKATVICDGFLGDSLLISSVPEQMKKQGMYQYVTYLIKLPQTLELLQANPYIDHVALIGSVPPLGDIFRPSNPSWTIPAPLEYQSFCGLPRPCNEYSTYIPDYALTNAKLQVDTLRAEFPNLPIVAYQADWYSKSFAFTNEEYALGIDTKDMGYGNRKRNIESILTALEEFVLVEVGLGDGISQFNPIAQDIASYTHMAAILPQVDFFIGTEGGISNIACSVPNAPQCIIDTSITWQLYGPNGLFKKLDDPQLGPVKLFPYAGHTHLSPFLTDEEVAAEIHQIIKTSFIESLYSYP